MACNPLLATAMTRLASNTIGDIETLTAHLGRHVIRMTI
jgi:hypothetical protein